MESLKKIALDGTSNGEIEVSIINEPYGKDSSSVASIGISLDNTTNEPNWKVHIPSGNIDDVIDALKEAKKRLG